MILKRSPLDMEQPDLDLVPHLDEEDTVLGGPRASAPTRIVDILTVREGRDRGTK